MVLTGSVIYSTGEGCDMWEYHYSLAVMEAVLLSGSVVKGLRFSFWRS